MNGRLIIAAVSLLTFAWNECCAGETTIAGTIQSVDNVKRRLTILPDGGKKSPSDYDVSRKAVIRLDGSISALDHLKAGQVATLSYDTTLEVVSRIEAKSPKTNAQASGDEIDVVATGVGLSPEKALSNAFRAAVEQTVGVLVDAKTIVANDQVVQDTILTASNAYIGGYDILKRLQEDGVHVCKIKATVKIRQLKELIVAKSITTRSIRGQDIAAEIETTAKADRDTAAVLADLIQGLPNRVLTAKVTGKPKPLAGSNDKIVCLRIPIELAVDEIAYKAQVDELTSRLDKLSIRAIPARFRLLPIDPVGPGTRLGIQWTAVQLDMPAVTVSDSVAFPDPHHLVPKQWFAAYDRYGYNEQTVERSSILKIRQLEALRQAACVGIDGGIDVVNALQRQKQERLAALVLVKSVTKTGNVEAVTYALPERALSDFPLHRAANIKVDLELLSDEAQIIEARQLEIQTNGYGDRHLPHANVFGFIRASYQWTHGSVKSPNVLGLWPGLRMHNSVRQFPERTVVEEWNLAIVTAFTGNLYVEIPVNQVQRIHEVKLKVKWEQDAR